mmetsp:Transcript_41397/g.53420  ORF Transcript_41397/g.53420 Transcript_41397/m.53420 type:complete len:102 (+) Transcript_41397:151-456(+)
MKEIHKRKLYQSVSQSVTKQDLPGDGPSLDDLELEIIGGGERRLSSRRDSFLLLLEIYFGFLFLCYRAASPRLVSFGPVLLETCTRSPCLYFGSDDAASSI